MKGAGIHKKLSILVSGNTQYWSVINYSQMILYTRCNYSKTPHGISSFSFLPHPYSSLPCPPFSFLPFHTGRISALWAPSSPQAQKFCTCSFLCGISLFLALQVAASFCQHGSWPKCHCLWEISELPNFKVTWKSLSITLPYSLFFIALYNLKIVHLYLFMHTMYLFLLECKLRESRGILWLNSLHSYRLKQWQAQARHSCG